jgi:transcriptional regulator with XRE-family HTH domain
MKETFGQRLQRLRLAGGISQPKLAAAADIPIGTLRNLEQDRRIPRLDTADALARALGVGLDILAGDAFATDEPSAPRGRPKKDAGAEPAPKKGKKQKGEKQ